MEDLSRHFQSPVTLTKNDIQKAGTIFLAILLMVCITAKYTFKETKRLAWVVSLVNSFVMSVMGIIYLAGEIKCNFLHTLNYFIISIIVAKLPLHPNILRFGPEGRDLFHSADNFGVLCCLWFGLANITDLAFGVMFYREQLQFLTAYFHHSVFIWMMYASTTGNPYFGLIDGKITIFATTFCFMIVEEIPTFILALGSVFPKFRSDIGFGFTFFILRICYHFYFFIYALYSGVDTLVLSLYLLTLTMHLNWFYSWVIKYGSGNKKAKKLDPKASD